MPTDVSETPQLIIGDATLLTDARVIPPDEVLSLVELPADSVLSDAPNAIHLRFAEFPCQPTPSCGR